MPPMTRAMFVGDSNTWAQHVAPDKRWPTIACKNLGYECFNLAQPGARSIDWHPNASTGYWQTVTDLAPTAADMLFVMLGSADTLGTWPPTWVPTAEWEYEGALLGMSFAFPGSIYLLAPTPVLDYPIFADHYDETVAALAGYTAVCRHLRDMLPEVEFVADPSKFIAIAPSDPNENTDFVDSVHLSETGEFKVACTVIQSVRALG